MSYIGNTPTQQGFTPAVDFFSGNASTTAFTLSRQVAAAAQVQVVVENVPQNPSSAFTVSGNTITFTSAPPTGTNNIYVSYTSPITQIIAPGAGTVGAAQMVSSGVTAGTYGSASAIPAITVDATGRVTSATTNAISAGIPGVFGQVFTSSGTFTIPSGVTAIKVTVLGGGGNGASSADYGSGYKGVNGGAGGMAIKYLTGLTPGGTLSVTVGGVAGTSSVASGTQTISTISATGGANGSGYANNAFPGSATGGIGSGGDLNLKGPTQSGGGSGAQTGPSFMYGHGGMYNWGGTGGSATGYGAGGAGGGSNISNGYYYTGAGGGSGTGGLVFFEW